MAKFFLFPALIKSVQNCPMASELLIGCTPGGIKSASLVYSAGNAFPFMLLYAAVHSLFAVSIAALILSWAQAIGPVNRTMKRAEDIACFIFMVLAPFSSPDELRTDENSVAFPATLQCALRTADN